MPPEAIREDCRRLTLPDPAAAEALWILLLSTSAGAHIVVATVPATREERKCVRTSSLRPAVETRYCFAAAYLAPGFSCRLGLGSVGTGLDVDSRGDLADVCVIRQHSRA